MRTRLLLSILAVYFFTSFLLGLIFFQKVAIRGDLPPGLPWPRWLDTASEALLYALVSVVLLSFVGAACVLAQRLFAKGSRSAA